MTNAEKYLKDGADKHQFAKEIQNCFGKEIPLVDETILDWLADGIKPTLTEDEKVILRNIKKKFIKIGRDEVNSLYFTFKDIAVQVLKYYGNIFDNVFLFIKEGEEYLIEELL